MANIDGRTVKNIYIKGYTIVYFDEFIKENYLKGYKYGLCGVVGSKGKNKKYINEGLFFDCETSHNHDRTHPIGWVYQWAFEFGRFIVYGRKPSQFIATLKYIEKALGLFTDRDEKGEITAFKQLKIFIHNQSFDLQFLKEYIYKAFPEFKMLNTNFHKILECSTNAFKFKCTYLLTGLSLADWCERMKTEHGKLTGIVDHNLIYYQNSRLKRENWLYMFYDVLSLKECTLAHNGLYNDNIATMPPTKTAYVRRIIRGEYSRLPGHVRQRLTSDGAIDPVQHALLNLAFAGGYTHANRFTRDTTVKGFIKHRDFVSHFISQLLLKKYPTGKFNKVCTYNFDKVLKDSEKYGFLMLCSFTNVSLKDNKITMPYLQESHIFRKSADFRAVYDNGRILEVMGSFDVCFTEIDLDIFLRQYTPEGGNIKLCYRSKKSYLPPYITDMIEGLFIKKTELKIKLELNKINGIEDPRLEADYQRIKELLNSIYGMLATNPIRRRFRFNFNDEKWRRVLPTAEEIEAEFEKMATDATSKNFNRYQYGVWCTAYSRLELFKIFELIGYENTLYSDTDSAFYISTPEIEARLDAYNGGIIEECKKRNKYVSIGGKVYYYGIFDTEPEEIEQFRALHSKCYAYVYSNEKVKSKLKITVAGVRKYVKEGEKIYTREEELGSIDNLKDGFTFKKCGASARLYIDGQPRIENVDGHKIETSSACIITPTFKTLSSLDAIEKEDFYMIDLG